jgi:hypothetical protein
MYTADYRKVTTYGDNGAETPRYTCWLALIPTGRAALILEVLDVEDEDYEARAVIDLLLPCRPDTPDRFPYADRAIEGEGFRLGEHGWQPTDRGYEARLEVAS